MKYVRQLDSLRAVAVLLVIISHWLEERHVLNQIFPGRNGAIGVDFFFVLSGFLITTILLANKEDSSSKLVMVKNFFFRRSLRIFPIYYLALVLLLFFGHHKNLNIQSEAPFYFTFTTNILFYKVQGWGGVAHLWSLAVEEQFYLIWPWVIVFVNRQYLFYVILAFVIVGLASNYVLPEILPYPKFIRQLTLACFDSFGLGALLAFILSEGEEVYRIFIRIFTPLAAISSILFISVIYFSLPVNIPVRTLTSILSVALIIYALSERKDVFYRYVLSNRFLIGLGKLSYGVYLYHNFIPSIWGEQSRLLYYFIRSGNHSLSISLVNSYLVKVEYFIFLMLVCWFSWRFIELPINNLKKHFDYKNKKVVGGELVTTGF